MKGSSLNISLETFVSRKLLVDRMDGVGSEKIWKRSEHNSTLKEMKIEKNYIFGYVFKGKYRKNIHPHFATEPSAHV